MDAGLALNILQWVAIVVLYLGFAAVLKETRELRGQVSRLRSQLATVEDGGAEATQDRLPARVTGGQDGIVVVADTTCPSCAMVLERLTTLRHSLVAPVTLLTWEPEEDWSHLDPQFRVVRDAEGWSVLGHLTPPLLARVDQEGVVHALHLPVTVEDVDSTLTTWGALAPITEREHA